MPALQIAQPPRAEWGRFALVLLAGIAGGVQLGKIPPLLDGLRDEFALSLVAAGLVASCFNLTGATLGIASAAVSDRLGGERTQALGIGLMALGNLAGAMAQSGLLLMLGRLLEGIGFVLAIVAGPTLITSLVPPEQRKLALGFWSTYMPAGVALGLLLTPPLAELIGWRGLWLGMAVLLGAFALLLLRAGPKEYTGGSRQVQWAVFRRPAPWLLAGCFACYTTQWFSIVTWLPTYLRASGALSDAAIALGTALVVLANLIGTLGAAALMHRGVPRWLMIAAVSLGMSLCGSWVFADGTDSWTKIALAFLASGFGGMLPASVLASVPMHARSSGEIATVNGIVVQVLNLGSFLGPPLLAALVAQLGGWSEGRWLLLAAGLLGLGLALSLRHVEARLGTGT